ncbi:interferon-induced, double-stranded RNA-activated protein kinase-like isoform X2 [Megalobrama amblycephala]|uniref:interferon-induced, double-stranded RNA-activated protein kinase-like isoform X2 n=1 Tax=Megalobrama amblycephala TaxID=75352 RepID=UPI0020141ACD|nr:interferon-induced, double-stranded RNA-activated protein kinase-like isoform X2 [Megalobrama amblycephala]
MESLSRNFISLLNEYQQRTKCTVEYEEGSKEGPDHNKTFTMRAIINGQRYPDGTGKTKKEAKQSAAKNALDGIKITHNTESAASSVQNISNNMTISHQNYICWLNEYSQKSKLVFKARETTKRDPGNSTQLCTYVCKYVCGDREFPEAYGKNKKEAKEAAASRVYEELFKTQNAEVLDENSNRAQRSEVAACSLDRLSVSAADESQSSTTDHNYIAYLNDFCQKKKRVRYFILVEKRGPPHNPEFVYKVVIDGKEYPEGQGKSSKEAKQHAAQNAWSEIRDQISWTTQSPEDDTSSQTPETFKPEDARLSSNSSAETPMAISAPVSQLDVKPKIKLAANFLQSPNGLAQGKEKSAKPSGGQTSNQAIKSRFLEDFDSINPIGIGSFGRVFKARRKLENKYYAVKIVKSREKACREVDALSRLNNANIVRYYTAWEEDKAYIHKSSGSSNFSDSGSGSGTKFLYIQMELCEGDTLRAWIAERNFTNKHFPERKADASRISRQVLTAVEYIHSKGLIHRDLKPANIMFSSEGGVKVGDFGLVTVAENDERLLERTIDTGSPLYMAPEQVTKSYDKKVDIYALGLIYFELLRKFDTMAEKDKIWHDVRIRNFPTDFSQQYRFEAMLVRRMLSPSPGDRPNATDLIKKMQYYLETDKDIKMF